MHASFLADGAESEDRYSVSIWRVAPHSAGPGAHCHETNEELLYVIEGTIAFIVGDQRVDAPAGSFLRVPAGVMHDFENNTARPAGVFNVFIPGGFEARMPAIVEWYRAKTHIEAAGIDSGCASSDRCRCDCSDGSLGAISVARRPRSLA
jgi:mannose-6-phosphate isomerase-like protein (cupin superfamily)